MAAQENNTTTQRGIIPSSQRGIIRWLPLTKDNAIDFDGRQIILRGPYGPSEGIFGIGYREAQRFKVYNGGCLRADYSLKDLDHVYILDISPWYGPKEQFSDEVECNFDTPF